MKRILMAATGMVLVSGLICADDKIELKTGNDKINYSVGYQLGSDFKRQQVDIKPEILLRGIEDANKGGKPLMSDQERRATLQAMAQQVREGNMEKLTHQGADNLRAGEAYLADNAGKDGVKTLPSGLQYRILTPGNGASPKATDKVTVHYRGTLIDGTEFDSSYSRGQPATFGVNQVIPGWTEALQLMKEGGKWQLYIPAKLAYGERGAGARIPPNSALIFDVELISVN